MSYDAWETQSDDAQFYEQLRGKIGRLTREMERLFGRLANLSLSDEEFIQTQDCFFELRQERESLKQFLPYGG